MDVDADSRWRTVTGRARDREQCGRTRGVRDAELWEAEARLDLAGSGSGGLYGDVDVKMATALEKDLYIEMMLAESWKEIFGEYNQLKLFTCMRELLRHEFRQGIVHSEVKDSFSVHITS